MIDIRGRLINGLAIRISAVGELRGAAFASKAAEEWFFTADFLSLWAVISLMGVRFLSLMTVVVMMVPVTCCRLWSEVDSLNSKLQFSLFWASLIYLQSLSSIRASINNAAWHTWTVTISISNLSHCSISTTSECRAHLTSFLFTLVTTSPSLSPARFAFPSANQRQKTFFSLHIRAHYLPRSQRERARRLWQ